MFIDNDGEWITYQVYSEHPEQPAAQQYPEQLNVEHYIELLYAFRGLPSVFRFPFSLDRFISDRNGFAGQSM